jgi:hypothetical protein
MSDSLQAQFQKYGWQHAWQVQNLSAAPHRKKIVIVFSKWKEIYDTSAVILQFAIIQVTSCGRKM